MSNGNPKNINHVLIIDINGKYLGELFLPELLQDLRLDFTERNQYTTRRFSRCEVARPGYSSIWLYVEYS